MSRLARCLPLLLIACLIGCDSPTTTEDGPEPQVPPGTLAFDADNGGLVLPDGFRAVVVAEELGRGRHLTVRDNGDIYLALSRPNDDGHGIVALRDTTGDGRADVIASFGSMTGTGIEVHGDHLYFAPDTAVGRYPMPTGNELVPAGAWELIAGGLPDQRSHAAKPFTFDGDGHLYVTVGGPSNACQEEQRTPGSPGLDPCPQLERQGGIWRYEASRPGQQQQVEGARYATGIRHAVAMTWNPMVGSLYVVQHGRDQLDQLWPDLYTAQQNAELPSEEFMQVSEGDDFGWPYCYNDHVQGQKVLAPEYGGDGDEVGRCANAKTPIMAFPGHYAPNDLLFYEARQFPARYQEGAFIAFHGSWNRAPEEQEGYNVVFVPFEGGQPSGDWEVFADNFAGRPSIASPRDAEHRPTGLAVGPDGSLYVSDSREGTIWRIVYTGA
ncbi:MAG: PQQ-dependent sugar dehydrogenase [Bacteroidota bacterium]